MKTKRNITRFISVVLTLLLSMTVLVSCKPGNSYSDKEAKTLVKYNSYSALQKVIQNSLKAALSNGNYYAAGEKAAVNEIAQDTAGSREGADTGLTSYSTTNLQVEGVDEADIVKTDGKYLYIIANGRFIIVDVQDPAKMKVIAEISYLYTNEAVYNTITPIEMFLDVKNNKLTLISYSFDDRLTNAVLSEAASNPSSQTASTGSADGSGKDLIAPDYTGYYYGQQNTLVQVLDLSDITAPSVEREFVQEGSYLSSRRIDEFVYIITNKYLYTYGDNVDNDYYIPATKDSSGSGDWEMLPVDSISVIPDQQDMNFLILSSLDTIDSAAAPVSKAIMGAGQNVYASTSNIYIASARYIFEQGDQAVTTKDGVAYTTQTNGVGTAEAVTGSSEGGTGGNTGGNTGSTSPADASTTLTDPVKGGDTSPDEVITTEVAQVFQVFAPPTFTVFTDIYRFAINDGAIAENRAGVVPGYILNQFSMDESNGYFRIATTTGDAWQSGEYTSMNNVYVLDSNLAVAGKIEGLATRETIKSVRFLGSKAYLVTFRTVDPLFVLDLSDPKNPVVKGELKIPGYSEYLHPISDTLVLGFGKDAIAVGDMAYYLGMKVSVFDVSDVSNPKEISSIIIGDRGTSSEVSYNHKALLYSAEENIIGFPITICQVPADQKSDKLAYGYPTFVGYIVLGLNADNTLVEKARISHFTMTIPDGYPLDEKKRTDAWQKYEEQMMNQYYYAVTRGVFINDTLFTISNAMVRSNSLTDFTGISSLDVPGFKEMMNYATYGTIKGR